MTCKTHPHAPHGFDRNGSHNEGRYVCTCEYWEPPQPEAMRLADALEAALSDDQPYIQQSMAAVSAIKEFLK